jgi:hypothetical protein
MHGAPSSRTRRRTARRQTRSPVTADLRVGWVAAVIARVHHPRRWIGVCDQERSVSPVRAPRWCAAQHMLLGALGVEGPTSRTIH